MIKNITKMEVTVKERVYSLLAEQDSPVPDVIMALGTMQLMCEELIRQHQAEEVSDVQ